jgi:cytochrome c5
LQAVRLVIALAVAGGAFAAMQELPEGEGKKLVEDRCTECHSLEPVVNTKMSHDGWERLVVKMVGYGARMDDKEVNVAADYLARYFGPQTSASQDEKTAQRFIEGICASCHDSTFIKETRATKEEWLDIVRNMNGKGAGLSERDVELLADYLAKNYGPK